MTERCLLISFTVKQEGNPTKESWRWEQWFINRVRCSLYPGSVVGVVYQSGQFSPVASGRMDLALASDKATAACYQAADAAMAGTTNVGNCVYFRTPVEGLTGISIGGHIFY